jgi:hypothetical protein
MRLKLQNQTKAKCGIKPNLLVLDDVEHELFVEEADETEATKPSPTKVW